MINKRFDSFRVSPFERPETINDFAQAGFYFTGNADTVRCFYCGGCIGRWNVTDSPWMVHSNWFKTCGFMKQMRNHMYFKMLLFSSSTILVSNVTNRVQFLNKFLNDAAVRVIKQNTKFTYKALKLVFDNDLLINSFTIYKALVPSYVPDILLKDEFTRVQSDIEALNDSRTCVVCLEKESNTIFYPCGHMNTCFECSVALVRCAVCRKQKSGTLRIKSIFGEPAPQKESFDKGMALLLGELAFLEGQNICIMCKTNKRNTVFLPCGHLIACELCALGSNKCFHCDLSLKGFSLVYSNWI